MDQDKIDNLLAFYRTSDAYFGRDFSNTTDEEDREYWTMQRARSTFSAENHNRDKPTRR